MRQCGPIVFLILAASGSTAAGQAMVGYGMGAARAVTTAAPAKGIGKAIDKALNGERRSEAKASKTGRSSNTVSRSARPAPAPAKEKAGSAPPVSYEDPARIEPGITYAELIRRFGPASMEITGEGGMHTMSYIGKAAGAEVVLRDGKVSSVDVKRIPQAPSPR